MMLGVILMIGLGFVERIERNNLGDNWLLEDFGFVDLSDVGFGNALLLFVSVKDSRAVMRADVGALPIEFRRIMSHGEEHL